MGPAFSVIIPSYNRAALIGATLRSVLAQRVQDFEIIVVDDGSKDGSADAARAVSPRVRVIEQANAGAGVARNTGAAAARGAILAFLDSDDLWLPWTLETFARVFDAAPTTLLAGSHRPFSDEQAVGAFECGPLVVERSSDYLACDTTRVMPGAGVMVVRREAFERAGGFAPRRMNAEDSELFLRLGAEPGFAALRSPVTLAYRAHDGSVRRQTALSVEGRRYMIARERAGAYPGGASRRLDRLRCITAHVRSQCVECLHAGDRAAAWELYRDTLAWHARLGRVKFLLGFPALALKTRLRG